MKEMHVVCPKQAGLFCIDIEEQLYSSRAWTISEETAKRLIGAQFFLHKTQTGPAYHGGFIFDVVPSEEKGRYTILYQASMTAKGVMTSKSGWKQELKLVKA